MKPLPLTLKTLAIITAPACALNEMTLVGQYDGEAADNFFGVSLTMVDFNDNGCEEFLIGAIGWNNWMGKNYLYDWNGDWPTEPIWTIQGTEELRYYSHDKNLGDINGDGIDDFCLGALRYIGRLDLFQGSSDFDTIPDWSLWFEDILYWMKPDSCGDVNGDGWNDFVINIIESSGIRETKIYHGGEVLDTIPDWIYPTQYQQVSGLGDVNGDGYADIMILDGNYSPPKLFFGGCPMDTIPDLIFYNYAPNGLGGGVGDVNGNGYNDFCIPMVFPDSLFAYDALYLGGPDVDNIPDVFLLDQYGEMNSSLHGISCGDFNGDGYSDIISQTGYYYGIRAVQIYLGGPWFNPVPDALVTGSYLYDYGEDVASGDVNGDGRDELLVSAVNYHWFFQGRVYLYTGPEEWIDYGAGIEPEDLLYHPGWFTLYQNFPNPFNISTHIRFELRKLSTVNLTIYDLRGNTILKLITNKDMLPGGYNVSWTGRNKTGLPVSSGIYLLELRVDQYRQMRKMVLMR